MNQLNSPRDAVVGEIVSLEPLGLDGDAVVLSVGWTESIGSVVRVQARSQLSVGQTHVLYGEDLTRVMTEHDHPKARIGRAA